MHKVWRRQSMIGSHRGHDSWFHPLSPPCNTRSSHWYEGTVMIEHLRIRVCNDSLQRPTFVTPYATQVGMHQLMRSWSMQCLQIEGALRNRRPMRTTIIFRLHVLSSHQIYKSCIYVIRDVNGSRQSLSRLIGLVRRNLIKNHYEPLDRDRERGTLTVCELFILPSKGSKFKYSVVGGWTP